jgi:asparagine synthase (glutamine-hydrolysing)
MQDDKSVKITQLDAFIGAYFWDIEKIPQCLRNFIAQITEKKGAVFHSERGLGFVYWGTQITKRRVRIIHMQSLHLILFNQACHSLDMHMLELFIKTYPLEVSIGKIQTKLGSGALVAWDESRQEVILAGDPIGRQVVYYAVKEGGVIWSSHSQPIGIFCSNGKPKISREGLNLYLLIKGIPAPWTLLAEVLKTPGGKIIKVSRSGIAFRDYWPERAIKSYTASFHLAQKMLKSQLYSSIRLCVENIFAPVGIFLSGGLDSTIIASIARRIVPICAFSVGYSSPSLGDETKYAALAAKELGIPIEIHRFSPSDAVGFVQQINASLPEPVADMALLPEVFLALNIPRDIKVVLDGTGADALFGGSPKFLAEYYRTFYMHLPSILRAIIKSLVQVLPTTRRWSFTRNIYRAQHFMQGAEISSWEERIIFWSRFIMPTLLSKILLPEWVLDKDLGGEILLDLLGQFPSEAHADFPGRVARISYMTLKAISSSVEFPKLSAVEQQSDIRVCTPFLSPAMIEFALALPDLYKVRSASGKVILRETFGEELPPAILHRPKTNFNPPIGQWLVKELRELFWETMKQDLGLFNIDTIRRMWYEHSIGWRDWSSELWAIFMLQSWIQTNC